MSAEDNKIDTVTRKTGVTEDESSPSSLAEDRTVQHRRRDLLTICIIAGSILAAGLVGMAMLPGYILQSHIAKADRALADHAFDAAIPHLKFLVEKYPLAWMRWKQLGDAYLQSAKPDPQAALGAYERGRDAVAKSKAQVNLNEELGICWSELGDDKKASEYFSKVLSDKPESPATNYYLGIQFFEAKQYRESARCFQASAADPRWDAKAEPYRRKLAQIVLSAPLSSVTPTPKAK